MPPIKIIIPNDGTSKDQILPAKNRVCKHVTKYFAGKKQVNNRIGKGIAEISKINPDNINAGKNAETKAS